MCLRLWQVVVKVFNRKLILIKIEIRIENEEKGLAWRC